MATTTRPLQDSRPKTEPMKATQSRQCRARRIRILVADREEVFRIGLGRLFGAEDDLRVVAQAEDSGQVARLAAQFKPDLLFVQAEIAAEGLGDLVVQVRQASPSSKIVITASDITEDQALRYTKAGASGVILKSVGPHLFVRCARKVMDSEVWLPKRQVARMAEILRSTQEKPRRPADTLTGRERMIISYLIQGWRNREIGRQLSITEQTVKNHLRSIYDKVGVSDRLELVLYAIHQRLELPPISPTSRPSP
jgi:two-component system, NarL family, nitrate/nitrite response regulator NarL